MADEARMNAGIDRDWYHLLKDRFHIIPYPPRRIRNRSSHALYTNLFTKFFKGECNIKQQRLFRFEGYWIAIQLFGGEAGLLEELRVVADNFQEWCDKNPERLEDFRNKARERGYEHPDISNIDRTVFANIKHPITVSEEAAKKYFAKYAQPLWILTRTSHYSHQHLGAWPGVGKVWGDYYVSPQKFRDVIEDEDADVDEGDEEVKNEDIGGEEEHYEEEGTEESSEQDSEEDVEEDEGHKEDDDNGSGTSLDESSVSRNLRNVLVLRQRALKGDITWQQFAEQTEGIATSVSAAENGVIEETAPDDHGDDNSSALTSSLLSKAPEEPKVPEAPSRLDAGTNISPRKRLLEDADPADGARPPPGPARWKAEFHEEAALDMSRTLSAPARRLAVTNTTHQGETWYVLAWGTQAAGMSAGVARAVQWIFTNQVEGSARWSGVSLRFILKFSRMGQYAVMGKVADAPLSQETVNKLASGAHAGSLQTPIAAQAKTAAALVSCLMGCGEGTVLQEMMGLSVADLIAEGAAIDDPIVAAILGGDPEEYLGNRADQVHRAVSPGFIELE